MPALPIFLLKNWPWLLGLAASLVLSIIVGVQKLDIASLEKAAAETALKIEQQKTEAANTLAAETAKARAAEQRNAELVIQLEKERADDAAKDAKRTADLSDAQRVWKQTHPGCRPGGDRAESPNNGAAGAAVVAPERIEILPVGSHNFISRCSADHDELARYARECHGFVVALPKTCQ